MDFPIGRIANRTIYDSDDRYRHLCPKCNRSYKHRSNMMRHYKYECGSLQRFECPYCKHHLRQRTHVWTHIRTLHPDRELYCVDIVTNARLTHPEYSISLKSVQFSFSP
ncbi:longitudinals lacking protein, isoforms A/B/D/L-like [Colletes latitarsis]|uniref:longitudinals lacking protein, isoforms A/B/D/L-like n=1 Tax=Colletes latitarsis TaxID=2605962 RepID=UPI004035878A